MIVTILISSLFILSAASYILCIILHEHTRICVPTWVELASIFTICALAVPFLVVCMMLAKNKICSAEEYKNMLYEKTYIESVMASDDYDVDELYKNIISFNDKLKDTKDSYNNPWISWFHNKDVAENIDYIKYKVTITPE